MFRLVSLTLFTTAIMIYPAVAQQPPAATRPQRPTPPTRDPNTPGYVKAKDLPDGAVPSATEDGNFISGPTHTAAPEVTVKEGGPQGTVIEFAMQSTDS